MLTRIPFLRTGIVLFRLYYIAMAITGGMIIVPRIKLIVPALEDINTLFEKISSIEHELKLAFDRRHPFYTKKEILQRLKLAQNELKTVIEELEQQRIVENKTRND